MNSCVWGGGVASNNGRQHGDESTWLEGWDGNGLNTVQENISANNLNSWKERKMSRAFSSSAVLSNWALFIVVAVLDVCEPAIRSLLTIEQYMFCLPQLLFANCNLPFSSMQPPLSFICFPSLHILLRLVLALTPANAVVESMFSLMCASLCVPHYHAGAHAHTHALTQSVPKGPCSKAKVPCPRSKTTNTKLYAKHTQHVHTSINTSRCTRTHVQTSEFTQICMFLHTQTDLSI